MVDLNLLTISKPGQSTFLVLAWTIAVVAMLDPLNPVYKVPGEL